MVYDRFRIQGFGGTQKMAIPQNHFWLHMIFSSQQVEANNYIVGEWIMPPDPPSTVPANALYNVPLERKHLLIVLIK